MVNDMTIQRQPITDRLRQLLIVFYQKKPHVRDAPIMGRDRSVSGCCVLYHLMGANPRPCQMGG